MELGSSLRKAWSNPIPSLVDPTLGGPGTYRFYVTCVPGPSMLLYNVPNDCTLGPSAGSVQNKQQVAGSPLSSVEQQQPSGRRPEGCSHSNTSSAASACTPNGKMSPLFWTCTLTTTSSAESADVVGCAIASSIQLRRAFTTWTERRVGNPARPRVWEKSMVFPRHTPLRAGPRPIR